MTDRVLQAIVILVGVPAVLVGYVFLVERFLQLLPEKWRPRLRPWLWLGPGLLFLIVFLVYPTIYTIILSLMNRDSSQFVGLNNYVYAFTSRDVLIALRNNFFWVVLFTLITVTLGLIIAVLTDRVSYENVVKSLIFLPMAISAVAAGVIWKFMYDFRPPGTPQTGTVNAIVTSLGGQPQAWLIERSINNPALIVVGVWMMAGFCMVILSAGLKGLPAEVLEAARVDGANEFQVFFQIIIPLLGSTIAVVTTTMIIFALKVFDIVYVMTNGAYDTEVIANRMYKELYNVKDFGRASAVAVILLAAIVPVMLLNIRRFRQQEEIR